MGQLLAGYDQNGNMFGAWCGGGLCPDWVQGSEIQHRLTFHLLYQPLSYNVPQSAIIFGGFRTPNNKSFNNYIGGRFYDPIFWAPKDVIPLRQAEQFFDSAAEFPTVSSSGDVDTIVWSSYVWSPAAMFHPDVHSSCGWSNPRAFPAAFKSPAVGQAKFPEIKSWMLEHHWLQNNESESNPSFEGGDPSWLFNQGYNSVPITLFFDGHVAPAGCREAMDADSRARRMKENNDVCAGCPGDSDSQCQYGLWSRDTQFGAEGYYGQYAYDSLVDTHYHILTTDGIRGRDFLTSK